jgi:hypothetical protein
MFRFRGEPTLRAGAAETFEALFAAGFVLAVLSNAPEADVVDALKALGGGKTLARNPRKVSKPTPAQQRAREVFARIAKEKSQHSKRVVRTRRAHRRNPEDFDPEAHWAGMVGEAQESMRHSHGRSRKPASVRIVGRSLSRAESASHDFVVGKKRKRAKSVKHKETKMAKAAKSKRGGRKAARAKYTKSKRLANLVKARAAKAAKRGGKSRKSRRAKKSRRSARKSVRRVARKSARKPVRKSARKSVRRSARESARKSSRSRKYTKSKRLANLVKARAAKAAKRGGKAASRKGPSRSRTYAKRVAALAKARAAKARKHGGKYGTKTQVMPAVTLRTGLTPNRRKHRKHRRNGKKSLFGQVFKRNPGITEVVKFAGLISAGLLAHKVLTAGFNAWILNPLLTPAAAPSVATVTPAEAAQTATAKTPTLAISTPAGTVTAAIVPAATSGLGVIPDAAKPVVKVLASAALAAAGVVATSAIVKDTETVNAIAGGMVASFLHTLVVSAADMINPNASQYLSGVDSTAARLSAMYGLGASVTPHHQQIGEYLTATNGVGEYFDSGVSGLGEYFDSGVSGLGNYGSNPDVFEAAAGYGSFGDNAEGYTNNIDPSSDLDRQLTIAEAAAGVGTVMEAAAGYGAAPYEAQAGFGSIQSVPSASTWIPGGGGSASAQLFAGVRGVTQAQSATAMVPAGILETSGGSGIFG